LSNQDIAEHTAEAEIRRKVTMKVARSGGNAFSLISTPTTRRPRPRSRPPWPTPGRRYAPGPAAAATTVSQAVDSWPTDPVRVPTTTDTQTITRMSTADARWSPGAAGRLGVSPADGEDRPLKVGKPSVRAAAEGRAHWAWLLSGPAAWSAGTGRAGPGWLW